MRGTWPVVLVALACFGPYVAAGVRTEQIAVYTLALLAVLFAAPRMKLPQSVTLALIAWTMIGIFASLSTLTVSREIGHAALSGADMLLLPIATVLIVAAIPPDRRLEALRAVAVVAIVAGGVNTALAWLQANGQMPIFVADWLPPGDEASGARAALQGRYTGALNQPALTGCFYGMALLLATWRIQHRGLLFVAWALLCAGGALSDSKAFMWVGFPIAVMHLVRVRGGRDAFAATAVIVGATGALYMTGNGNRELIAQITGNRYGIESRSNVLDLARESLAADPLGHGLARLPRAADSQWLQVIDFSGLFGVVGLAVVLGCLVNAARRAPGESTRQLSVALVALTVVASLAFPLLTGNRLAPLLWMSIALAITAAGRAEPGPVRWSGRSSTFARTVAR